MLTKLPPYSDNQMGIKYPHFTFAFETYFMQIARNVEMLVIEINRPNEVVSKPLLKLYLYRRVRSFIKSHFSVYTVP